MWADTRCTGAALCRCSYLGDDLNRHWLQPSAWAHREISATKELLMKVRACRRRTAARRCTAVLATRLLDFSHSPLTHRRTRVACASLVARGISTSRTQTRTWIHSLTYTRTPLATAPSCTATASLTGHGCVQTAAPWQGGDPTSDSRVASHRVLCVALRVALCVASSSPRV